MEDSIAVEFLQKELENLKSLLVSKDNEIMMLKSREETQERSPRKRQTILSAPRLKKLFGNTENEDDYEKTTQIMFQLNATLQLTISEQSSVINKLQQKVSDHEKKVEDLQKQNTQLSKELKSSLELCLDVKEELYRSYSPREAKESSESEYLNVLEHEIDNSQKGTKSKASPRKYPLHIKTDDSSKWLDFRKRVEYRYSKCSDALDRLQKQPEVIVEKEKCPFEKYMENSEIFKKYQAMLKKEASEENLLFFIRVKEFKTNFKTCTDHCKVAQEIYNSFLKENSPYEININQELKNEVLRKIQNKEIHVESFLECYTHVISTMMGDSFMRFKISKEGKDLLSNFEENL